MKKTIAMFAVGAVLLIGVVSACATGNGAGPDLGNSKSDDTVAAHWNEVTMGMSKGQVTSILGTPDDSQHMEVEGLTEDCIYYENLGKVTMYQFCFDNGSLNAKNQV